MKLILKNYICTFLLQHALDCSPVSSSAWTTSWTKTMSGQVWWRHCAPSTTECTKQTHSPVAGTTFRWSMSHVGWMDPGTTGPWTLHGLYTTGVSRKKWLLFFKATTFISTWLILYSEKFLSSWVEVSAFLSLKNGIIIRVIYKNTIKNCETFSDILTPLLGRFFPREHFSDPFSKLSQNTTEPS